MVSNPDDLSDLIYTVLLGIILMPAFLRGLILWVLGFRMIKSVIPDSIISKTVLVAQALMYGSFVLVGFWLKMILPIPLYIVLIVFIIGSIVILLNTKIVLTRMRRENVYLKNKREIYGIE